MDMIRKIGILVADDQEFHPLRERICQGEYREETVLGRPLLRFPVKGETGQVEGLAFLCGVGKVNAAAGAMMLIDLGCECLLNYGLSGGISGISRGEICLCDRFLEHDFDLTALGYRPCEKPGQTYLYRADEALLTLFRDMMPGVKEGTAVTGDCFVSDAEKRDFLKHEFGAMSCDMETAAIASVCFASHVPFAAIRRISDDAGEAAVETYREMNRVHELHLYDWILRAAVALADQR
ncbi:MAG: 5'-methylthioadenosine/S-adenosylhomocysteine nucleosidase [Clostridia bacterium]|nr:5'-methylthioadenosine/S-adenosylhomocysteine nucleosidase [Clostridia bacterium]